MKTHAFLFSEPIGLFMAKQRTGIGSTYADAGVSLERGDAVVRVARQAARATLRPEVLSGIGGFGAAFRIPGRYRRPVLVAATDGVGTKLRVAAMAGRHDTVGVDLVAMNVNDILTLGAEPLVFLDYFVAERLDPSQTAEVLRGVARGCKEAGCALVGGETAEHPGCFVPGEYDLAGFVVGVVEETELVDGRNIVPGDVIIGLASSGLHSNGFSLVRHILFDRHHLPLSTVLPEVERPLGDELLKPTRIYVRAVRALPRSAIKGMAHITGGGIVENLARTLPRQTAARLRMESWPVPGIFRALQRLGPVAPEEMFRTFNMGLGFLIVVPEAEASPVLRHLHRHRVPAFAVGQIVPRRRNTPSVQLV